MRKNETDTYKKMKEDKRKRDFIRPRLVFRVKKITSVITGVLGRKKKHLQVKTEEREMILQKKLLKLMRPWLLLKQRLETTRRRCLIPLEICHIHFFSHGLVAYSLLRFADSNTNFISYQYHHLNNLQTKTTFEDLIPLLKP